MNASVPRTSLPGRRKRPAVGSGLADAQRSTSDQEVSFPIHAGEYEASFNDGGIVEVEVLLIHFTIRWFIKSERGSFLTMDTCTGDWLKGDVPPSSLISPPPTEHVRVVQPHRPSKVALNNDDDMGVGENVRLVVFSVPGAPALSALMRCGLSIRKIRLTSHCSVRFETGTYNE